MLAGNLPPTQSAPGPTNEPPGFIRYGTPFDGSTLPPANRCQPPNQFGMCGWPGQLETLSLESEDGRTFMRMRYPGRQSPLRDRVWSAGDYGGRAPSRFSWVANFGEVRARHLYIRMEYRLSPNWTSWGAKPPDFTTRAWNSGVKFFFPRVSGQRADGSLAQPVQNDYIALSNVSEDPREPSGESWSSNPGRREGITHEFQMQMHAWGFGNVPRQFVCGRGVWCQLELLLTLGDTVGSQVAWMNGKKFREQPVLTPWRLSDGTRLADVWWGGIWADPTFGGGLNIPWDDQWVDYRLFYVSLK